MSGYLPNGQPLPPHLMMEDIVGDYKDKTVTLEDFPFFANNIKMASVHPCKHASVMKTLLDRADGALKIRREKLKAGTASGSVDKGMEGLVDEISNLDVTGAASDAAENKGSGDEWEEVGHEADDEVAIRVDQYLVVFLKVSAILPIDTAPRDVGLISRTVHRECHSRHRARFHDGCLKATASCVISSGHFTRFQHEFVSMLLSCLLLGVWKWSLEGGR